MKAAEYYAAIKAKHGITSDYALAKLLGISTAKMSGYSSGERLPGPLMCFKIAELLGDQAAAVVADIELERSERGEREADVAEWRSVIGKLPIAAVATILVAAFMSLPIDARAGKVVDFKDFSPPNLVPTFLVQNGKILHIVSIIRRCQAWLKLARKRCADWLNGSVPGMALSPA